MLSTALRAGALFLLTCALAPSTSAANWTPGTYVGVGDSIDCVTLKAKRAGTMELRAGGCDWRFVCGSNGSRGAPVLQLPDVRLRRDGRFKVHHEDRFEFGGDRVNWDVTGIVEGKRASGTFRFHYGPVCDTGTLRWNATLQRLTGGPYSVTRGEFLRLDGAATPRKKKRRYRWRLSPGPDCPAGANLATSTYTERRPMLGRMLCGLKIKLTTRDSDGETDSERTTVRVTPRADPHWHMSIPSFTRTDGTTALPELPPPDADADPTKTRLAAGALRCPDGKSIRILCKQLRYSVAKVSDGGAAFDGWTYVTKPAADMALLQIAFLNPAMEPFAPPPAPGQLNWYHYNLLHGVDAAAYRDHTLKHEGMGWSSKSVRDGHMQAIITAITHNDAQNDPRRFLETRVGPDHAALAASTLACLEQIEKEVFV